MTTTWSADPAELLRAANVDLATLDRRSTPGWPGSKKQARAFMAERGKLLSELQERLFAHGRTGGDRSVLLVVQGIDTSGKGGIVRHVIGMVDPQGVALRAFAAPTAEELEHHFLWRVRNSLPKPGYIGVFDRSHYEDVLVARVDELVTPEVWSARYDEINRFEAEVTASGTTIVKVALMPSYHQQGLRLMRRLDRVDKHWKYSPADADARAKWDDYQRAYADAIAATSSETAPWHVIPADRRWYPRLVVTELLTRALLDLGLGWPAATFDIDVERVRLKATMSPELIGEARAARPDHQASVAENEADFAESVAQARDVPGPREGR